MPVDLDSASKLRRNGSKHNKEQLVQDIRLLGCIPGDVIREQEGAETSELIQQIANCQWLSAAMPTVQ